MMNKNPSSRKRAREKAQAERNQEKQKQRAEKRERKANAPARAPGEDPDLAGIVAGPQPRGEEWLDEPETSDESEEDTENPPDSKP
jgi:hypothetical protein